MILYFDTFIIDRSLSKRNPRAEAEDIRSKSPAYKLPRKIDIAKYTLASYAVYPWSNVLIKYELAEASEVEEFDKFILNLFPKAVIQHERSDSQEDYKKSLEILNSWNDPWIFYAPNNDHPLVISQEADLAYIDRLIKKAEKWIEKYKFVSIPYSHFTEYYAVSYKSSANHKYFGSGTPKLLEEDEESIASVFPKGDYNSIQIVHKDLFNHWFTFADMSERRVMRAEDVGEPRSKLDSIEQLEVIPKKQLAFHFDGYEHMLGYVNEVWNDLIPPYIVPEGFFENNIKIAYGYDYYKEGFTNINPAAKKYSFRDLKEGVDLKISLEDIPLFWKSRIKVMDINPNLDKDKLEKARLFQQDILKNPWTFHTQGFNFNSIRFRIKLLVFPYRNILDKLGLIPMLKKLFRYT